MGKLDSDVNGQPKGECSFSSFWRNAEMSKGVNTKTEQRKDDKQAEYKLLRVITNAPQGTEMNTETFGKYSFFFLNAAVNL